MHWDQIKKRKQALTDKNTQHENNCRIQHHYKVGNMVLLEKPGIIPKLESPHDGPYEILKVYNKGTVRIKVNGAVKEWVNIRCLTPFNQWLEANAVNHEVAIG